MRIHHDGALALVRRLHPSTFESDLAKLLILYLFNIEVSSALHERRSPPPDLYRYTQSVLRTLPSNPSFRLDQIGFNVARYQASFSELLQRQCDCTPVVCARSI